LTSAVTSTTTSERSVGENANDVAGATLPLVPAHPPPSEFHVSLFCQSYSILVPVIKPSVGPIVQKLSSALTTWAPAATVCSSSVIVVSGSCWTIWMSTPAVITVF